MKATLYTNRGIIGLDLFPSEAPKTVDNFVRLAHTGFYDGVTGEGMSLALLSARRCAEAVHQHLWGNAEAFATYDREWSALARNSHLLGRLGHKLRSSVPTVVVST